MLQDRGSVVPSGSHEGHLRSFLGFICTSCNLSSVSVIVQPCLPPTCSSTGTMNGASVCLYIFNSCTVRRPRDSHHVPLPSAQLWRRVSCEHLREYVVLAV